MFECPHCGKEMENDSEIIKFSLLKIKAIEAEKKQFICDDTSKWAFANKIFFTIFFLSFFTSLAFLIISLFQGKIVFSLVTELSLIILAVLFVVFAVINAILQHLKERAGEIFDRTYPEEAEILNTVEKMMAAKE